MDRPGGGELLQLLNDRPSLVLAITCGYVAEHADAVREHARCGGFPVTTIRQVRTLIDPITAESG